MPPTSDASRERREFRAATPFRHLVLDGFLDPDLAHAVARESPDRDDLEPVANAVGRRALFRRFGEIGPAFAAADAFLRSERLLARLGALAGETLSRNPDDTCGGLFQDHHGPGWDPHLDVNCTVPGRRRRLTVLLYLNREWRPDWGGALELYAGSRGARPKKILPAFNRAVLISCHERAWHGVAPIDLPAARRRRGRLALIVNYYGLVRPHDAPPHFNRWMPKPLPKSVREGRTPTAGDAAEARRLLERRSALLRELRGLEAEVLGRPAPAAAGTPSDAREQRRAAERGDRELRRLYSLEYKYRRILSCASR